MMKGLEVIIWEGSDFNPVSTVSLVRQHDTSLTLIKFPLWDWHLRMSNLPLKVSHEKFPENRFNTV